MRSYTMGDTVLKLDANEGRMALGPGDLAGLGAGLLSQLYPEAGPLEEALAASLGLPEGRVLATAGADDALDRAVRALACPGGAVLATAPAFEEYAATAGRSAARYLEVPRPLGAPLPLAEVLQVAAAEKPALIVVASPDNPSGGVIGPEELKALAATGIPVLFDATYIVFQDDPSLLATALGLEGVITAGSFSKSHGLAGFRLGWAAASPATVQALRKAGPPYALSSPAIEVGLEVLARGPRLIAPFVAEVKRERPLLRAALAELGAATWEAEGNFVSALVGDSRLVGRALADRGIQIRTWKKAGRENLIRITCPGEAAEFQVLLKALKTCPGLARAKE